MYNFKRKLGNALIYLAGSIPAEEISIVMSFIHCS